MKDVAILDEGKGISTPKYCIVFICQYGELEIRSVLLAASLRRYLKGSFELVAAVPTPVGTWGELRSETRNILKILDVKCQPIVNPISPKYPMLNKLAAIGVQTNAPITVYLDADIICINQLDLDKVFNADCMVKPADCQTYSMDASLWERIYKNFGLPLPERKVFSTVDHKPMFPYFNSGVVAVKNGKQFAKVWTETCKSILSDDSIADKEYWVCQIALPIAIEKCGYQFTCLKEIYNFPVNLKCLNVMSLPVLCHYKSNLRLRAEPILVEHILNAIECYPELRVLLHESIHWKSLLVRQRLASYNSKSNYIITGIPRSGTSLLCNLLHRLNNSVVINEPLEIFEALESDGEPWGVPRMYADIRRNVLEGIAVQNKLLNGDVVEDTFLVDERVSYFPSVVNESFFLATKNTLSYLARLKELKKVMPDAPVIVCIRNPYDCIASWKSTFDLLKSVDIDSFPVGGVNDKILSEPQLSRLKLINNQNNISIRRAMLWRHLALLISENMDNVIIVKYEDLISDTKSTLIKIISSITSEYVDVSDVCKGELTVRTRRDVLTELDVLAIKDICGSMANEFGYDIDEL